MLLGLGYLSICYALFLFLKKQKRIDSKKSVVSHFFILFFSFSLKYGQSDP